MLGSQQGTSTTTSNGSALNGNSATNASEKSAVSSLESKQVRGEHGVNSVGFWNIMALVEL